MTEIKSTQEIKETIADSIKKWTLIYDGAGIDEGPHNCPLCKMFWPSCVNCPVEEYSGKIGCLGTPYEEWIRHQESVHQVSVHQETEKRIHCGHCAKHAKDEINFLEEVLEWYEEKHAPEPEYEDYEVYATYFNGDETEDEFVGNLSLREINSSLDAPPELEISGIIYKPEL